MDAPDKAGLGFLPASAGSWAGLSVRQNLDFVAGIYGLTGDDLAQRRSGADRPRRDWRSPRTARRRSCPEGCAASSDSAWR